MTDINYEYGNIPTIIRFDNVDPDIEVPQLVKYGEEHYMLRDESWEMVQYDRNDMIHLRDILLKLFPLE